MSGDSNERKSVLHDRGWLYLRDLVFDDYLWRCTGANLEMIELIQQIGILAFVLWSLYLIIRISEGD